MALAFVWNARRPLHPQRFWDLIHSEWDGVLRSKGFFWLATRPSFAGNWSQAGGACRHGAGGYWWASVPKEYWPQDDDALDAIADGWDDDFGDRKQQIVFIGIEMNEDQLKSKLNACLLTDAELAENSWGNYPDPFPVWGVAADDPEAVAA